MRPSIMSCSAVAHAVHVSRPSTHGKFPLFFRSHQQSDNDIYISLVLLRVPGGYVDCWQQHISDSCALL